MPTCPLLHKAVFGMVIEKLNAGQEVLSKFGFDAFLAVDVSPEGKSEQEYACKHRNY